MELTYEDLEDGIRAIRLKGRLDLEGADAIDLKLTSLVAVRKGFVILPVFQDFASARLAVLAQG
jgi:hypothetical protein